MANKHLRFWPSHLPHKLTVPEIPVCENLLISAKRYPHKTAIIFYEANITYSQLLNESGRLATYLNRNCQIKKGDRVILDLQNSPQFVIAYYGIMLAGGIVVPINPMSVTGELEHYCKDSGATTAIASLDVLSQFEPLLDLSLKNLIVTSYDDYLPQSSITKLPDSMQKKSASLNLDQIVEWNEIKSTTDGHINSGLKSSDIAAILYTSGTTGKPKGCTHTHGTLMQTLVGAAMWENMHQDSVSLSSAPMFHVTGMQHSLNAVLYTGSTMVILPRWDPKLASLMIEEHQCTHWANVPTMVVDLLADKSTESRDLSSLKVIFGGGSAMPQSVAEDLFAKCGVKYMEGYGMTETISQTHMNPPIDLRKQCLGIPTFGTEAIIIDPDNLTPLGSNKMGEILVHGPQIMQGYWGNPKANSEVFVSIESKKFLRTGDLGYADEDGFFYIADRLKRMINCAGFKVWPAEVESILYKNPKIKEVAIISSPHERRGETVKAVISLKDKFPNTTDKEIISWSKQNMAAYKVPKLVSFMSSLPKSGTGKIQWRLLQEKEWEGK